MSTKRKIRLDYNYEYEALALIRETLSIVSKRVIEGNSSRNKNIDMFMNNKCEETHTKISQAIYIRSVSSLKNHILITVRNVFSQAWIQVADRMWMNAYILLSSVEIMMSKYIQQTKNKR